MNRFGLYPDDLIIPYSHQEVNRAATGLFHDFHGAAADAGFEGIEGEAVLLLLDEKGICASSGSACTTGAIEPSHVLKAMGASTAAAHGSIRFSLSRYTTEAEIDYTIDRVVKAVNHLREMSPLYEMAQAGIDLSTVEWQQH